MAANDVREIANGLQFPEGPIAMPDGSVVVTEIRRGTLSRAGTDGTVGQSGPLASGHIPTQGEDYCAVLNGRTPLVDYISQYVNLLPIAVEPILRAFNDSITAFSITARHQSLTNHQPTQSSAQTPRMQTRRAAVLLLLIQVRSSTRPDMRSPRNPVRS